MDWNSLKIFIAITNSGSLSGAAKELGVNHSTIFRRLNSFEDELGGRLFERINNRYELTAMGEELLVQSQTIADSFDDIDRHIVGKDFQPKGTVKITAPNNIAYRFLPRYIAEFNKTYPDIHIELLASNQAFNMNNREADIAVRATRSPPDNLIGRNVCTLNWSVFASKAYKDRYGYPQTIDDLKDHVLIGGAGAMQNLPGFIWLEKHFGQQINTRCDELMVMSSFAKAGQGLAFLPSDQVRSGLKNLFPFPAGQEGGLWLLSHPDLRNVERIKLVIQHLTESFANEPRLQN
ncbi:LysR family transcriptional regulator [Methylophaga sp. 41_12_T18]|nr:LysR family transcriptional regulator [Methylophaga sp. 41_12_T18]